MNIYVCPFCHFEEVEKGLPNINKVCKNCGKISRLLVAEEGIELNLETVHKF